MATERELLEDPDALVLADATGRRRPHDRLDVHVLVGVRVLDRQIPTVAADRQLALPHPVAPLGMPVADAEHLEVEQRLEADRDGSPIHGTSSISNHSAYRVPGFQPTR